MARRIMTVVTVAFILTAAGCKASTATPVHLPSPLQTPQLTLTPILLPSPSPSPTTSLQAVASTSTPTQEPSTYLGMEREGGIVGGVWNLADVRHGLHPDRVRVVWEMAESREHVPRYEVIEVDNAVSPFPTGHDPSWGVARIDLVVSDLYAFDFPLNQRLPITPPENPCVTRIGLYPTFSDSHLGFSIGLKRPLAYQVYELRDPVRIAIDVLCPE